MASQGPNNAGVGSDSSATGTVSWLNASNATGAPNATYATALFAGAGASHYLILSNFGFSIPAGATINGIAVTWYRSAASSSTDLSDAIVSCTNNGATYGTANYASGSNWPAGSAVAASYGGPADLWGGSWNYAIVNGAGFGVAISVQATAGDTARVDAAAVTVYYTPAGSSTPAAQTCVAFQPYHPAMYEE